MRSHARVWTATVEVHRHDSGPLPRAPVSVCPGLLGGVLTPMALAHGLAFAPVVDLCMQGSSIGYESFSSVDYEHRGRGELVALDALSQRTGRTLWSAQEPAGSNACPAVAGTSWSCRQAPNRRRSALRPL